jgi:hypothetical protein
VKLNQLSTKDLTVCRGSKTNLPVKVRRGELSVHLASEDPVLRGDSQDRVDRENFLREMQWGSPIFFFNFDGMRIQGLSLQRIT